MKNSSTPPIPPGLDATVVKYSLPQLLAEVEMERRAPAFSGEKLGHAEIAHLFQKPATRRVLKKRQ